VTLRVVVAPDKFKGSLTAAEAADAMRQGVLDAAPSAQVTCVPVADGGEGTVDAFVRGGASAHELTVAGPLGEPAPARFAIRDDLGVVESAQACGLALVERPDPRTALAADTSGVASLVFAAVAAGARRVLLGLGGSASTDGGAGLARGLGVRLLDASGRALPPGGGGLATLDRLDVSKFALVDAEVLAGCDVQSPLVDAARVFATQKGAGPAEIARLEAGLARWAEVVARDVGHPIADVPGGGAAGGLGAGAVAFLRASIVSGVNVVLDLLGFAETVRGADLVLTGEGSFDVQSLTGKAPIGVARVAHAAGVPTWVIAGRASASAPDLAGVLALTDIATPDAAIRDAAVLLRRRAADLLHRIAQHSAG
jgi:glycerate 2-kinase